MNDDGASCVQPGQRVTSLQEARLYERPPSSVPRGNEGGMMLRGAIVCCSTLFVAWLAGTHSAAAQAPVQPRPQAPAGVGDTPLPPEEAAQHLVAMVSARFGDEESLGAGVIFDKQPDTLYIVTAEHVVRRGATDASNIRVLLKALPGESLSAHLLNPVREGLDLAVLRVDGTPRLEKALARLRLNSLGNTDTVKQGDQVSAIGQPNGQRWDVGGGVITRVDGTTFAFQSPNVAPGSSGGGLFDARRQLIGLVQRDSPPTSAALRIDVVARALRADGYSVAWQHDPGAKQTSTEPATPITPPVAPPETRERFTGPMGPLEDGVSYSGGDMYDRPSSSAAQCAQLCAADDRCRAVTFITSQQRCWVKDTINAPQYSGDLISSRKQPNGSGPKS